MCNNCVLFRLALQHHHPRTIAVWAMRSYTPKPIRIGACTNHRDARMLTIRFDKIDAKHEITTATNCNQQPPPYADTVGTVRSFATAVGNNCPTLFPVTILCLLHPFFLNKRQLCYWFRWRFHTANPLFPNRITLQGEGEGMRVEHGCANEWRYMGPRVLLQRSLVHILCPSVCLFLYEIELQ